MSNVRIKTDEAKERVTLYLNPASYKGLQKKAQEQDRSVSNLVNLIIKNYLK